MEWMQFIIFFVGVFGLFIWNRAEARADMRRMDTKLDSMVNLMDTIRMEALNFQKEWLQESKDFHNRFCEIEKKKK